MIDKIEMVTALKCNKCGEPVTLTSKVYIIKKKIYCKDCLKKYGKELME